MGVRRLGPDESKMFYRVWSAASRRPETMPFVTRFLFQYAQIRHMFGKGSYWEPMLGDGLTPAPVASPAPITLRARPPARG